MQRLLIGKSLSHIAAVFKTDWWMFITIGWLPLVLIGILKVAGHYALPDLKEVTGYPQLNIEIILNIYSVLYDVLSAIILVGIYRYLLKDSRFRIKIFILSTAVISKRLRSIPFYLSIDKSTVVVAILLIIGSLVYRFGDHVVRVFVVDQMKDGSPKMPFNMLNVWRNLILPLQIWSIFYFALSTQLCLINPYVATARRITGGRLWQNIIALKKTAFRLLPSNLSFSFAFLSYG